MVVYHVIRNFECVCVFLYYYLLDKCIIFIKIY